MNDTTRRFLSAITERVPAGGRIVELRLFPAIRQGGIESGVAVVAVEPPAVDAVLDASTNEDEAHAETTEGAEDSAQSESLIEASASAPATDAPAADTPVADTADADTPVGDAAVADAAVADTPVADTPVADAPVADAPVADAPQGEREVPLAPVPIADDRSAAAALALVDTDIAPEDEEGTSGDSVVVSSTYIPSAGMSDDDDVSDALDDEMTTIVVDTEREVLLAESRNALHAEEPTSDAALHARVVVEADSPYADAPPPPDAPRRELLADVSTAVDEDPEVMRLDDILALPSPDNTDDASEMAVAEEDAEPPRTIQRYAILTASYRLTIKGPDRGKWDVDLTHEADAPLATVERVARGVAKRSGDGSEPEHFSGESLKQALDAPAWIETT